MKLIVKSSNYLIISKNDTSIILSKIASKNKYNNSIIAS